MAMNDFITWFSSLYFGITFITLVRAYRLDRRGRRITGKVESVNVVEDSDNFDPDRIRRDYYRNCRISYHNKDNELAHAELVLIESKKLGEPVRLVIIDGGSKVIEDHYWAIYRIPIIMLVVFFVSVVMLSAAFLFGPG